METINYLGKGIIFPLELNTQGGSIIRSDIELIKTNIRGLLAFELGKRFFQGQIGSRIKTLLSEATTPVLKDTINFFIREVLEPYEPRVKLVSNKTHLEVNIIQGKVSATITCIEVKTGTEFSFVVPFYKTPGLV